MSCASQATDVAVLIPAYNDQAGLDRTLKQLSEEAVPCSIYVVDDGSNPVITAEGHAGSHPIHLIRLNHNQGIEHALNAGLDCIDRAGHRFIARLDCGDLPMAGRIGRQVAALEERPELGIIGTWARCIDDDGAYLFTLRFPHEHEDMVRRQRYLPAMLHPSVMIRAETLQSTGRYSDRFRTAEDYDLFVRISRHARIGNIPEVLTEYIVSATGTTASKRRRNLLSRLGVQRAYFEANDPHAYFGIARTLLFIGLPFSWLTAAKRRLWR